MTVQRQPRVKGGRKQLPSCVLGEIKYKIEKWARKYNVSRSYVVSVILADALNIDDQPRAAGMPKRRNRMEIL